MEPDPKQVRAEEQQVVANPVEEQQEAVMPAEDQQLPNGETEVIEESASSNNESELPDGVSERTKEQFDKLKEQLRQRDERLKKYEQTEDVPNVFDTFRPKAPQQNGYRVDAENYSHLNQTQVDNILGQFIDESGNLDADGLNNALVRTNREVQQAKQMAQESLTRASRYEENEQTRRVHETYPELNPENRETFNRQAYEMVRDRMTRQMIQGAEPNFVQAANDIMTSLRPKANVDPVKTERLQQQKAQVNQVVRGQGQPRESTQVDYEDLRQRTRQGDPYALHERLRRLESQDNTGE